MTYVRVVCNYQAQKKEKEQTRIMIGRDRTNCSFDWGTPIAELLTIKLLLNSVIFTLGVKFMTIDISNFYLITPMDRYEFLRMKLDMFPEDSIE